MSKKQNWTGDLQQLQTRWTAEILNANVDKVLLKLNQPWTLQNCRMRRSNGTGPVVSINSIGGETFTILAVYVKEKAGLGELVFRIAPTLRSEYQYAEITKKDAHAFYFICGAEQGDLPWFIERMLDERDDKATATNRERLQAAIVAETKKIQAQQLSSHAEFGSW